eukprot:CAMPEP_0171107632 /NCGR_PEP_ID=MMETSP0766_2-20121228/67230_1 /TAXON_ID=439317 /ORGANISM="Gambierdiscus australes, Strain CAWD 149" /LENGTH=68 /DNA_ID=CAMNT_0011568991 /DNA_START=14 /DNA_END=216 /DNA_ORIENTATION=+
MRRSGVLARVHRHPHHLAVRTPNSKLVPREPGYAKHLRGQRARLPQAHRLQRHLRRPRVQDADVAVVA